MKKKLLALLLAAVTLVSCVGLLAGCKGGSKSADLVGNWTAEMDLTEGFKQYFEQEAEAELAEMADYIDGDLFDFSKLNAVVVWKMDLDEDGAITMSLDAQRFADSIKDVMGDAKDKIIEAVPGIMEATFAEQGMTMDEVEAALAAQGMSLDDLVAEMAQELETSFESEVEDQLNSVDLNTEASGYYTVHDGKIYVMDNEDDKPSEDSYLAYELNGGELVVTDMPDELKDAFAEIEEASGSSLLPLTFKRG